MIKLTIQITNPAGKKSFKKTLKKKKEGKGSKSQPLKEKSRPKEAKEPESKPGVESDDEPPVRQSRRIAQLKIREEAQRRRQEELALRELKIIHKKKVYKTAVSSSLWQGWPTG